MRNGHPARLTKTERVLTTGPAFTFRAHPPPFMSPIPLPVDLAEAVVELNAYSADEIDADERAAVLELVRAIIAQDAAT